MIYYQVTDEFKQIHSIEEVAVPCAPATSSWFSSIPFFLDKGKNLKDWFEKTVLSNQDFPVSVKACPGISDLFKSSVLLKFHQEVLLQTNEEGQHRWRTPQEYNGVGIASHSSDQFTSDKNSLFQDKINIKFLVPVNFHTPKNQKIMFLNPTYHCEAPYIVMPGLIQQIYQPGTPPVTPINTLFPKVNATYHFKVGDPLAYIFNTGGDNKLVEKNNSNKMVRNTFFGSYKRTIKN